MRNIDSPERNMSLVDKKTPFQMLVQMLGASAQKFFPAILDRFEQKCIDANSLRRDLYSRNWLELAGIGANW
jgi:hypothetical protein